MKRVLALLLSSLIVLYGFTGCKSHNNSVPPSIPSSFETDLLIIINESKIKAHMRQTEIGSCTFTINSPKPLIGMMLTFENSICTIEYKGIKFEMDFARFPETAFGSALVNSLIAMMDEAKLETTRVDDNWQYKGESKSGSFLLIQNGETGAPVYLSIPSLDLTIEFSNFIKILK